MEINKIKVYIKADNQNRITAIGSGIFIADTTEWIEIDEGYGDKYAHAQNQYLERGLVDPDGCYNYKHGDGAVVKRTSVEKQADIDARPAPPPTTDEQVTDLQIALIEQFEARMLLEDRVTDLQLALCEIFEGR